MEEQIEMINETLTEGAGATLGSLFWTKIENRCEVQSKCCAGSQKKSCGLPDPPRTVVVPGENSAAASSDREYSYKVCQPSHAVTTSPQLPNTKSFMAVMIPPAALRQPRRACISKEDIEQTDTHNQFIRARTCESLPSTSAYSECLGL